MWNGNYGADESKRRKGYQQTAGAYSSGAVDRALKDKLKEPVKPAKPDPVESALKSRIKE
jgi:hypothetical protein